MMKSLITPLFLLLTTLHASTTANPDSIPKWVELEYSNFAATIQAHQWTCVLLYDPWDERSSYEHTLVMEGLADRHATIGFGRLSARHHAMLRDEYLQDPYDDEAEEVVSSGDPFAKDYYDNVAEAPNAALTLTNETLLDLSLGTPYWPAKIFVLAPDYNLYGIVDLSLLLAAIPLRIKVLDRWLVKATTDQTEGVDPLVMTRANIEKLLQHYQGGVDNAFDFESYERAQRVKREEAEDDEEPAERNLRLLLESGSNDDGKASNNGHFTYRKGKIKKLKTSFEYLETLGVVVEEYLAWVAGYETTWSDERKAREDEQTNFGFYMRQMTEQIQALLDRILDENQERDQKTRTKMFYNKDFASRHKIPNLKGYFEEMVFGSGRSAHRMRSALDDIKTALGGTAKDRQLSRYDFNSSTIPMVTTLRDYMTLYVEVRDDDKRYSSTLAQLVTDWYNIMREFHKNLNQYYMTWLEGNPRPHGNAFQFQKMDVIDMKDPSNYDLLVNYDAFHEKYTKPGIPVVLSNVEMAGEEMTMEYVVSQCAQSIVTASVHVSHKVGERQAGTGWGGLEAYKLDDELLTLSRQNKDLDPDYDLDSDDESDAGEDGHDRSLTMEQFSILAERLDHLYLHDFSLPDMCDRILYDDTVYNPQQKFKIPSVVASWDLFQRLPQGKYSSSWPSLFVGKKGTNSKLHIDSGATGFFMYLVSGRKRWVVYNRAERVHVYEKIDDYATFPDVLGTGKDKDSDDFLSERFPLLHRAEAAYEIIQEPGQLVWIPPSCPHAVENLEDIVGLAMNIVPRDGVANHFHDQLHNSFEFGLVELAMNYWMFEDTAETPFTTEDPLYTTYGEYKAQY